MKCEKARLSVAGVLEAVPDREVTEHLVECDECRALLVATSVLEGTRAWGGPPSRSACLGDELLGALVEGMLDGRQRQEVIAHVASCESCARQLVPISSDLESLGGAGNIALPPGLEARAIQALAAPAARTWSWSSVLQGRALRFVLAGSAAVALLAVGIHLYRDAAPFERRPAVLRGGTEATVTLVSPRGEASRDESLRFVWRQVGQPSGAPRYRLLVVDLESGATILEAVTAEVAYTPSPEEAARFRPGAPYHWLVEPLDDHPAGPSETAVFRLSR